MNEPLLLIPGLMCDARVFLHQITHLAYRRPVMVAIPRGATVEEMSQTILAAAPAKFALVGLGLGGDVALDILRRSLDRVTRVVLISTDPLAEMPNAAAAREARMVAARAGRLKHAVAEELPPAAFAETSDRPALLSQVTEMAVDLGEGYFLNQSRALQRRPDQQKTLRRAMVPALVVAGAEDGLVPLRRQEFTADLMPYATLKVIAGAGHLVPLEQPEATSEAIETFLSGPMLLR